METNQVPVSNETNQNPSIQGDNGNSPVNTTGLENQSQEQNLADLQRQNEEYDKYLSSKGGEDKAKAFIEEVEKKRQLVEAHKKATKDNSGYVWDERLGQVEAQYQQTVSPTAPQPAEQPQFNSTNKAMIDEMNRNILRDVALNQEGISDLIQSGEILKEMNSLGMNVVNNGLINRQALESFAQLKAQAYKAQQVNTPSSNPTPEIQTPNFERVPEGKMTAELAIKMFRSGEIGPAHPDWQRMREVLVSGKTS